MRVRLHNPFGKATSSSGYQWPGNCPPNVAILTLNVLQAGLYHNGFWGALWGIAFMLPWHNYFASWSLRAFLIGATAAHITWVCFIAHPGGANMSSSHMHLAPSNAYAAAYGLLKQGWISGAHSICSTAATVFCTSSPEELGRIVIWRQPQH